MRRYCFLVNVVLILCAGCSWNYDGSSDMKKYYYQVHAQSQNSESGIDSIGKTNGQTRKEGEVQNYDLQVEGRLIVDGGRTLDISDTFVTVKEVLIRLWVEGKDSLITYYPTINETVAEPALLGGWDMMPLGVRYDVIELLKEPVTFSCDNTFHGEIMVCYVLRVRETELAANCTADLCLNTIIFDSHEVRKGEQNIKVVVPLELRTIRFNAIIEE